MNAQNFQDKKQMQYLDFLADTNLIKEIPISPYNSLYLQNWSNEHIKEFVLVQESIW